MRSPTFAMISTATSTPSGRFPLTSLMLRHLRVSALKGVICRAKILKDKLGGLTCRDLLRHPYRIENHRGDLSDSTIYTNISNADGTYRYDKHNLCGTMMTGATCNALLHRRPGKRPLFSVDPHLLELVTRYVNISHVWGGFG